MEALDVRAKLGPDKIIGVSAHTVEEALLAEKHGADYLGVGAVFPTGSKDDVRRDVLRDPEGHLRGRVHSGGGHRRHLSGRMWPSWQAAASAAWRSSAPSTPHKDIKAAAADLKAAVEEMLRA